MSLLENIIKQFPRLNLSPATWKVLGYILAYSGVVKAERFKIHIDKIAEATGLHEKSVIRSLSELQRSKIILKARRSPIATFNHNAESWQVIAIEERIPTTKVTIDKSNKITSEEFQTFWNIYPRKSKFADTFKAWMKLNPSEELVKTIMDKVGIFKKSKEWKKDGGKWIPSSLSFLQGQRWKDDIVIECDWRNNV